MTIVYIKLARSLKQIWKTFTKNSKQDLFWFRKREKCPFYFVINFILNFIHRELNLILFWSLELIETGTTLILSLFRKLLCCELHRGVILWVQWVLYCVLLAEGFSKVISGIYSGVCIGFWLTVGFSRLVAAVSNVLLLSARVCIVVNWSLDLV